MPSCFKWAGLGMLTMPHSLALHEAMVMSPGVELEERNKTKRGEKALANRDTMLLYRSVPVSRICSQDKD